MKIRCTRCGGRRRVALTREEADGLDLSEVRCMLVQCPQCVGPLSDKDKAALRELIAAAKKLGSRETD